jgi:hypothetical protein
MKEPRRTNTKANLGDKFGIVLEDGTTKIDTIRNHIRDNCAILYKHVYRPALLELHGVSLRPEAFKAFNEKLKKDHPELIDEVKKRRIAHRITKYKQNRN